MMLVGLSHAGFKFDIPGVFLSAPAAAGVYAIYNEKGCIYAGESRDIARRIAEHYEDRQHCIHSHGPAWFAYELISQVEERASRLKHLIESCPPLCSQQPG